MAKAPFIKTLSRYAVVGSTGSVSDWAIFAFLLYVLDWYYMLAGTLSFVLATLINYLLSILWVFNSGRHARHLEVTLIYLVSAIGLLINLAALYLLVEWAAIHVFAAKILASVSAFLWNFTARYLWVFERPLAAEPEPAARVE